jgi:hypothetical protein
MAYCEQYQTQTKPTARPVLRVPRVRKPRRVIQRQTFQPTLHTRYAHPDTGDKVFGIVPPIDEVPISASAPITLTHGWQSKTGGMGVSHIWHGHAEDVIQHGGKEITDVPRFVADIIQPGSPILRLENEGHQPRLGVYRAGFGLVVLGPKRCGYHWRWLVITAYKPVAFTPRNQVGRIEIPQGVPA